MFVYDNQQTHPNGAERISVDISGNPKGGQLPSISANGMVVAFESSDPGLAPPVCGAGCDGDTAIESNEDPDSNGGSNDPPTYNVRRWNLQLPPHLASTQINIGDLNALISGAVGSPARPPMFGGSVAFFTNSGRCPFPPS